MFGESPSRMEVKRLQSRLVQMENSLTVAHQAEEKAKEELARLRQSMRQRSGLQQHTAAPPAAVAAQLAAAASGDPQQSASLPTAVAAAQQETADAVAAAELAHAEAERAQLRDTLKATEIEGLRLELAEAKQRADMSSALFHRSVDADTAELQVHKLQETSVMQLDHMRSLQQKLNAARAEAEAKEAAMQRMNGRLAEATYATEAATAKGAALQERLQGALAAIASLEAKAADRKAVDRKQTESLQAQYSHEFLAAHAALQEEHERLLQKSAKAGEMQDAVQAALSAKDKRIADLRSELDRQSARCEALNTRCKELEDSCEAAQAQETQAREEADSVRASAEAASKKAAAHDEEREAALKAAQGHTHLGQAAADAARGEAQTAADVAAQAEARASALEAARAAEERKCSELRDDLARADADLYAKAAHISALETSVATLQARLGVVDQISEAAAARAAELAEARAQMTQKLGHIASLRAELDDERARSQSLAQELDTVSSDLAAAQHELAAQAAVSPAKLRMSRSDSEDKIMDQDAAGGGNGWPSPADYLRRRSLDAGSAVAGATTEAPMGMPYSPAAVRAPSPAPRSPSVAMQALGLAAAPAVALASAMGLTTSPDAAPASPAAPRSPAAPCAASPASQSASPPAAAASPASPAVEATSSAAGAAAAAANSSPSSEKENDGDLDTESGNADGKEPGAEGAAEDSRPRRYALRSTNR